MAAVLRKARIRNASPDFNANNLRSVAQLVAPARYTACNKHLRLDRCGAEQLLDCLYGVDHVIDVGEGVYAGIDLTLNAAQLSSKVSKATSLTKLRAAVGIRQFFVVQMIGDFQNPEPAVVSKSIDSFWEALEDAFNGKPDQVRVVRFHVS